MNLYSSERLFKMKLCTLYTLSRLCQDKVPEYSFPFGGTLSMFLLVHSIRRDGPDDVLFAAQLGSPHIMQPDVFELVWIFPRGIMIPLDPSFRAYS